MKQLPIYSYLEVALGLLIADMFFPRSLKPNTIVFQLTFFQAPWSHLAPANLHPEDDIRLMIAESRRSICYILILQILLLPRATCVVIT